ncbi:PepSY domain-containing protein [Nocardia otitidiscaviarum]|uniref:PepSY domain-containing protein n=1 Tax=Nocardia otitidiscaviarum TaxID=1823 RepID=A0A516NGY1_9NOCA|nr:PepSY domain-containing protein [Nocardia otitidiscaviarum]MCP9623483.1 PepSY domain-containing protein [Nocardia otitidiscaviarum]QDP78164.1 PepSY domain-containing protein [Nocardia otitidiscaviarum]
MLRLHFYAGVFVAPFILIAAVTGALYAIAPTLENITERGLLHTDSTGPVKPLSDQIRAAVARQPDLALAAVAPAQGTGDTTRVIFTDPTLGASERRAVFVDPVTAEPLGDSVVYGSSGALPMRTWIDQLHRDLHLGEPGRLYSELAASWLWVIALAGLVLWIRRVRARRERRSARWLLWPDRSRPRGRSLNWHAAVGVWILPIVLLLSVTGMTWSTYAGENIAKIREEMSWTTPKVSSELPGAATPSAPAAGEHSHHAMPDPEAAAPSVKAIEQADLVYGVVRANGIESPVEISIPAAEDVAFTAKERRMPGVLTVDSIAVNGASGEVTDLLRYSDWSLAAKLTNWGIQFHMGLMFGLLNQLLLLAVMVGLITVIVRGYLMWWRRRPTRDAKAFAVGKAPRRGVLRQTPLWLLLPFAAAAVVVGWFAPLIGLSVLGFLVVDVVVGLIARRRASA